jgi:hypothetical protein
VESFDITSEILAEEGIEIKKEGVTIAINRNGQHCTRSSIYKSDWNKTISKLEKKLEEAGFPQLTISSIVSNMSANYNVLMSWSSTSTSSTAAAQTVALEAPTEKLADITPKQWHKDLIIKYQTLQDTIKDSVQPLSQLKLPLEFALSVKNILNISNCTLPFAGVLLGVPSSLKTVTVELFRPYWNAKYSDDFSPKAFVSHYSGLPEEDLQKKRPIAKDKI